MGASKLFPRDCVLGSALALTILVPVSGCHKNQTANIIDGGAGVVDNNGPDPADVNLAPVSTSAQSGQYPQVAPRGTGVPAYASSGQPQGPIEQSTPNGAYPDAGAQNPGYDDPGYDAQVDSGLDAVEEADQPPPPLPVYEQPEAPAPNYLWTPGYWGYAPAGYYWVPGAWCAAPYPGALWTPGYWGYAGNRYRFHRGFWGLHIGFYGGIPYGFGYTGTGYHGGSWSGNNFFYNRSVNHINVTRITNVYNRTVIVNNVTNNRISYNGGRGGIQARPGPSELAALREPRTGPMQAQLQNRQQAAGNRGQFFSQNSGRPAIAAAARPFAADRGITAPVRPSAALQARPTSPAQVGGRTSQREQAGQTQGRPGAPQGGQPEQRATRPVGPEAGRPQNAQDPGRPEQRNGGISGQNRPPNSQQPAARPQGGKPGPEARPQGQTRPGDQARPESGAPQGTAPGGTATPAQQPRPDYQARPVNPSAPQGSGQGARPGGGADRQNQAARPTPQTRPESGGRGGQGGAPAPRPQPSAPSRPAPQSRPEQGGRAPEEHRGRER